MELTKSKSKLYRSILLLLTLQFITFNAFSLASGSGEDEDFLGKPSEYELERMAPRNELEMLSTNLAGENISLADGGLSFSATDVSVPLNMAVNATISRSYSRLSGHNDKEASEFGDWQLNLPRIEATALHGDLRWTPNYLEAKACSFAINPGAILAALGQVVNQHEYWNGATLTIPGQGGGKLLSGNTYGRYETTDNMSIDCGNDSSGNEYFIVKTPNGLTYSLKQRRTVMGNTLIRAGKGATRKKILYLVTDIEDRFGNTLNYLYQGNGLLQYIKQTPKNGVQETLVTLVATGEKITSITSFGKTWRYEYADKNLSKVIRPDNTYWQYEFPNFYNYAPSLYLTGGDSAANECTYKVNALDLANMKGMRVTNPYGAVAEFDVGLMVHGRTEVPAKDMVGASSATDFKVPYNINACYGNLAIIQKRLTLKDATQYQWSYNFSNNDSHWNVDDFDPSKWSGHATAYTRFNKDAIYGSALNKENACKASGSCVLLPENLGYERYDLRVLTVTEPSGNNIKYYTSKRWDHTDGEVVATQWFGSNNSLQKTVKKTFVTGPFKGASGIEDEYPSANEIRTSHKILDSLRVLIENGNTYTTLYDDYNDYGALLQSHSFNSFTSNVRHTKQDYKHDTTDWLLNLPTKSYVSETGVFVSPYKETSYYSDLGSYKSSPYETRIMGQLVAQNSLYHADGNLKKVEYIGTGRYELFEDYKRGKAQKVTLPCQKTNNCNTANGSTSNTLIAKLVVNNDGTIKQMTDFSGYATNYGYNDIGWLTKIDPVDTKWSNTNISYSVVTTANDGLSGSGAQVGQLKQTITKGSYQKQIYFDSMLRPYLTRGRDTSHSLTTSYQRSEYDYENRVTFSSFPSSSIGVSAGVLSDYDALGRKTSDTRTTDNASTQYRYLSNNRVAITDAKNNTTTTTYLAYGSPSYSKATNISSPKGVTAMNYNLFGQVETITQGGVTESRIYDNYQQLCKTVRPETGITAFGYNSARQLAWQAEGASGSTSACDTGQISSTQKTMFSYNHWGNVSLENYPDGSPDKVYSYDENGQLEKLTAGSTVWDYQYNSLGLIEKQTLAVGSKSFVINPEYNSLGHVQSLTYPSGRVVDFAPNALGQATKAGSYATNAKYHANGSLDSFTYGNNLTYKRSLNNEQQPYELSIKQGSSYKSRHRYLYDDNNNVDYIYDFTDRSYDIDLGYDGLDRLAVASGKWGNGSFSYDDLGNILTKSLGSQTLTYHYDTSKNRLSSVSGSAAYSFQYDARGNVANNGRYGLIFNRASQLINAKGNAYIYDGHNRLVKKVSNGKNVYSVYGMDGTLYYREDSQQKKTDYIRLGSELVAKDDSIEPTSPPNAVTSLSGYLDSTCNPYIGCHSYINWQHSSPSTVTFYELYQLGDVSSDPCSSKMVCANAISKPVLPTPTPSWKKVYSGGNRTFSFSYTSSSLDFKVRACNALGCSAYSAVTTISNSNEY
jgi:hypothetical protein